MGDAEDVIAIEEAWPEALAQRDRPWLEEHTADDFVFISPDGVLIDRDTYLRRSEVGNEAVVSRVNKAEQARVVGDVAIVIGWLELRVRDSAREEQQHRFRYTSVYVRSGGVWQGSAVQLTPMSDTAGA